jgi:hypothetical protein
MVRCGICDREVTGPFRLPGIVTGDIYLQRQLDPFLPELCIFGGNTKYFMLDGYLPHYATSNICSIVDL